MQVTDGDNGTFNLNVNEQELEALYRGSKELSEGVGNWDPRVHAEIAAAIDHHMTKGTSRRESVTA